MRGHPFAQLVEYLIIRPGLARRVDDLVDGLDHKARVHIVNIIDFQEVGGRQDDIGVLGHGAHELVGVGQEIEVHQGRYHLFGVGQVDDLLPAHAEPDLDDRVAA